MSRYGYVLWMHTEGRWYILDKPITYYSKRFKKSITAPQGMRSDGASGPATDICTISWWIHDWACTAKKWDDGTPISCWQASALLGEALNDEGRWFRCHTWRWATFFAQIWTW